MEEKLVVVMQHLRPDGRIRITWASVPEDCWLTAQDLDLSGEVLPPHGEVLVLYAKRRKQPLEMERTEFASNGPGPNCPVEALVRLIRSYQDVDR